MTSEHAERYVAPVDVGSIPDAVVINLARSPDRLASLRRRFEPFGIIPERFEAIDAIHDVDRCMESFSPTWFRIFAGRDWLLGEIGCALSHLGVWASLEHRADQMLLVLEDDAIPEPVIAKLGQLIDALPSDWEILVLAEDYSRLPWWREAAAGIGLVRYFRPGYLATGYVVHRRILRKSHLWTRPRPVRFPFDHWRLWSQWHGVAVYATQQPLLHSAGIAGEVPNSTIGRADSVQHYRGMKSLPKVAFRIVIAIVAASRFAASILGLTLAGGRQATDRQTKNPAEFL